MAFKLTKKHPDVLLGGVVLGAVAKHEQREPPGVDGDALLGLGQVELWVRGVGGHDALGHGAGQLFDGHDVVREPRERRGPDGRVEGLRVAQADVLAAQAGVSLDD